MLLLIFIYYFKNILCINDLHHILAPLVEKYFSSEDDLNLTDIYNEVFSLESEESKKLLKDIGKKYNIANQTFNDFPEEDQKFLRSFSFICMLSFDVYIKKMIIEQVIDDLSSDSNEKKVSS